MILTKSLLMTPKFIDDLDQSPVTISDPLITLINILSDPDPSEILVNVPSITQIND